jgi:hypothetical protein
MFNKNFLAFGALTLSFAIGYCYSHSRHASNRPEKVLSANIPAKLDPRPATPPVPLQVLAANLNPAQATLSPDQLAEDQQIAQEQIDEAEMLLSSIHEEERLDGAEQLALNPNPRSERLLIEALRTDTNPEVRAMAANSLRHFRSLAKYTCLTLLSALSDRNEEVRDAALTTLIFQVQHMNPASSNYKAIRAGLKKSASSKLTPKVTRDDILDFIAEQ